MEVILIKDVDNLGGANEVVKVKNGYARNFLIPRKLAVENSPMEDCATKTVVACIQKRSKAVCIERR